MDFADLLKRFAGAVQSADGDALAELFTPDGIYDDYFFGPSTGREATLRTSPRAGATFAGSSSPPRSAAISGTPVIASASRPSEPRPAVRA